MHITIFEGVPHCCGYTLPSPRRFPEQNGSSIFQVCDNKCTAFALGADTETPWQCNLGSTS